MEYILQENLAIKAITNHIHSDRKKRHSFLALLFTAGDVRVSVSKAVRPCHQDVTKF